MVRCQAADGKRSKVVIDVYPDLSVAQAHGKAADVHLAARTGAPIVGVRAEARAKAANRSDAEQAAIAAAEDVQRHSFTVLSEAWLEVRKAGWAAQSYRKEVYVVRTYLQQPKIGRLDMRDLRSKRRYRAVASDCGNRPQPG